jgi:hypothetical protein
VNVVWALFNMGAGYILFRVGRIANGEWLTLAVFFAGIAALSIMASVRFQAKHSA